MSTQHVRDIKQYFPTEPWLERYCDAIEASETYDEYGANWGVDWEGAFIFQIEGVPLEDRTIADLPEEIVDALNEEIRSRDADEVEALVEGAPDEIETDVRARDGDIHEQAITELHATALKDVPDRVWPEMRTEIPEILQKLLTQLEENLVDDDTVYAYLDVYDGGCREVNVVQSPDDRDHGFCIIGEYDKWKKLVEGDGGIINMVMSGELEVDGDMQKILEYSEGAVTLTGIAGDLETRFIL